MNFLLSTWIVFVSISTLLIIFVIFATTWSPEKIINTRQLSPVKSDSNQLPQRISLQEQHVNSSVDQKNDDVPPEFSYKFRSSSQSMKMKKNYQNEFEESLTFPYIFTSSHDSDIEPKDGSANSSQEFEWKFMNILAKERLAGLQRGCRVNNKPFGLQLEKIFNLKLPRRPRFYFSDKYKLLLCEVPKCGSTSWKRALLTMEDVDITKEKEHLNKTEAHDYGIVLNLWEFLNESDPASVAKTKERIANYTRVMTVREPLERLVSAYKDKMLPNGSGGESYGALSRRIHDAYRINKNDTGKKDDMGKSQSHVTWEEFVRYLVDENKKIYIDAHWQLFSKMCYPCDVAYHYVAKLETIYHDISYLSKVIGYDMTRFFPASKERRKHEKWSTEYKKYYTVLSKEDREKLYKLYMEQYDLFGYSRPEFL